MYCVNHPSVETRVTCSNCDKPVCPDCMVFTPVGAKCPECARVPKSALVTVKPERVALTVVAGVGTAIVGGILFGVFVSMIGFLAIMIAFGLGYGIGEAVSWASGRHHSRRLAIWAAACAVFGVLFPYIASAFLTVLASGPGAAATGVEYVLLAGGVWKLLWIAAAAYGAWNRNV